MATTLGQTERATTNLRVFVLGDVNLDTLIVPLPTQKHAAETRRMAWLGEGNFWRYRRRGGAWLLTEIINAALASLSFAERFGKITAKTYDERDSGVDDATVESSFATDYLSSAALLGLFPQKPKEGLGLTKRVYRIEKFLGWVHPTPDAPHENDLYERRLRQCLRLSPPRGDAMRDILVFHDRAGYFRNLDSTSLKEVIERHVKPDTTWIVWHMYSPLAEGRLWEVFNDNQQWLDQTIVVVKMECLRQAGLNLPETISLEQESHLFVEGMKIVPRLKKLARVRHIVAHQQRAGVLHYDRQNGLETSCYYCPYITDVPSSCHSGLMVGYTSNLIAAIVRGMVWSLCSGLTDHPKEGIIAGIKQGTVLDHLHYLNGFGDENDLSLPDRPMPYAKLFATLTRTGKENWDHEGQRYHLAALDLEPGTNLATWSRIEGFMKRQFDSLPPDRRPTPEDHAAKVSSEVVRWGLRQVVEDESIYKKQLAKVEMADTPPVTVFCPFEARGKIKTAYRREIDSFASIRRILQDYLNQEGWASPLSIAVFGPPGSGKSFTIQQILASVRPDIAERPLTFNLSQMQPSDLAIAFHKVQDEVIAGKVPLVFFDEFDTEKMTWLKDFLAPMEDGKFKAGESTYRIGRAVFVFAGGVSKNWFEFCQEPENDKDAFKNAKGPDFVSRLRGYLNIESINPPKPGEPVSDGSEPETVSNVLMFRRAILLRSLLEAYLPKIFNKYSKEAQIDPAVVRAFLQVTRYEHEARSMRAIIQTSQPSPRGVFQKSSLPTAEQLKMHVNDEEFGRLVSKPDLPD